MKVKLISWTNANPLKLVSLAGRACYSSSLPEDIWETRLLDVEELFERGHHTLLEHFYLNFLIEDIAISDVTFGLHLTTPFYNSSQRSGRYSAKMFWQEGAVWKIEEKLSLFLFLTPREISKVLDYLLKGIELFRQNHKEASRLAAKLLKEERPFISDKNLERWAPKVAQEQLRVFISTAFPTALVYTIDLMSLAALWRVAWTESMRRCVRKMAWETLARFPELSFLFEEGSFSRENWNPSLSPPGEEGYRVLEEPRLYVLSSWISNPSSLQKGGRVVDILHYAPWTMNQGISAVESKVEVSLATFGQDQRHRTIRRSEPVFSGNFYLPPLLQEMGLEKEGKEILDFWLSLREELPGEIWTKIAPYGAMVRYRKTGSLNAVLHEQSRRLCWRAQEEIYWLSCQLREDLGAPEFLSPPCLFGHCPEGDQSCGRDRSVGIKNYFPRRKV